jgi:hypothetical protein
MGMELGNQMRAVAEEELVRAPHDVLIYVEPDLILILSLTSIDPIFTPTVHPARLKPFFCCKS